MRIGLISDCHLERPGDYVNVVNLLPEQPVDVFVVAGDATSFDYCFPMCELIHEKLGCDVIFVPGNHEYYSTRMYNSTVKLFNKQWEASFSKHDRLHFLQNNSIEIGGVHFFGTTWWTNFEGAADMTEEDLSYFADFSYIHTKRKTAKEITEEKNKLSELFNDDPLFTRLMAKKIEMTKPITKDQMIKMNKESVRLYKKWYKETEGKKVLISHFPMLSSLQHPYFEPSGYFVSGDRKVIEKMPPDLLIYGHTHYNIDVNDAGTPCVSNMYGYRSEVGTTKFKKNKVFEI